MGKKRKLKKRQENQKHRDPSNERKIKERKQASSQIKVGEEEADTYYPLPMKRKIEKEKKPW